jgi:hypothetical protein
VKTPIPEAALKKHIAILGMNGSGKTSVAKSQIIEPALERGDRVCNIDPTGVGWGLRLSKTGKSKGYPVYVIGGDRADFPLVARDGKAWAEIVGTSSDSFVFDTSQMTVSDRSRWFTDFAETLIRKNKGPLHLVIDEMHLFAPQAGANAGGLAPQMLHSANNLLALGRSRGLRITMISQRPAKLHKDALTQAHTLIAMALIAPQDRKAVKEWIADQADEETGKDIIASLPSLKPGEGWIWAPREKVLERVRFSRPTTFDSSSAPDDMDSEAVKLAPVDPESIKAKLETVAKETVSNDPVRLKAEIVRLTGELAKKTTAPIPDPAAVANAEKAGFERGCAETRSAAHVASMQRITEFGRDIKSALDQTMTEFDAILRRNCDVNLESPQPVFKPQIIVQPSQTITVQPSRGPAIKMRPGETVQQNGDGSAVKLGKGERTVMRAVAQYPQGATREQITVLTGYKRSTRDAYLQRLRNARFIEDGAGSVSPTQPGIDWLGADYEPLPTGDALRAYWLQRLPEGEQKILQHLIEAYPQMIDRSALDEPTGFKRSTRDAYIQRLTARKLVILDRGSIAASELLFG